MKKINILSVLFLLLFSISCKDSFLDEKPASFLSTTNAFKTVDDFNASVNGLYGSVRDEFYSRSDWQPMHYVYRTDLGIEVSVGSNPNLASDFSPTGGLSNNHWTQIFKIVSDANTIISRIPNSALTEKDKVAFEAGRIMLSRINELLNTNQTFAFETTLASKTYKHKVIEAQQKGYTVTLLFFWLQTVELAKERVKTRVSEGGHNIPVETIRRRYSRGKINLITKFIWVCDYWIVINNSSRPFTFVAEGQGDIELKIHDELDWQQIKNKSNEEK